MRQTAVLNREMYLSTRSSTGLLLWKNFQRQQEIGKDEKANQFGLTLISGDFNGDNKDDLVVTVGAEKAGYIPLRTTVVFIYHGTSGSAVLSPMNGINP